MSWNWCWAEPEMLALVGGLMGEVLLGERVELVLVKVGGGGLMGERAWAGLPTAAAAQAAVWRAAAAECSAAAWPRADLRSAHRPGLPTTPAAGPRRGKTLVAIVQYTLMVRLCVCVRDFKRAGMHVCGSAAAGTAACSRRRTTPWHVSRTPACVRLDSRIANACTCATPRRCAGGAVHHIQRHGGAEPQGDCV